jgi:hypothetical protein
MSHTTLLPTRRAFRRELAIALLVKLAALVVLKLMFLPSRVPAEAAAQGVAKQLAQVEAQAPGTPPPASDKAFNKEPM